MGEITVLRLHLNNRIYTYTNPCKKIDGDQSYEHLIVKDGLKNRTRRKFLSPFCIQIWHIFHRGGIVLS